MLLTKIRFNFAVALINAQNNDKNKVFFNEIKGQVLLAIEDSAKFS